MSVLLAVPPEVKEIALLAVMNPAALLAGYWLGRRADQPQKLVIVGLASGVFGVGWAWLLMRFGFATPRPSLLPGVLIACMVLGLGWGGLGYWSRRHRDIR